MGRGLDGFLMPCDVALCGSEGPPRVLSPVSGGHSERETPLPIPNRAVKPLSADGTWPARAWESRTPPVLLREPPCRAARCGGGAGPGGQGAFDGRVLEEGEGLDGLGGAPEEHGFARYGRRRTTCKTGCSLRRPHRLGAPYSSWCLLRTRAMTSSTYSVVLASPPRSGVRHPEPTASSTAS